MFTLEDRAHVKGRVKQAKSLIAKLGIELTWSEEVALGYYYMCMDKIEDTDKAVDAQELFLINYFGLSFWEYGREVVDVRELKRLGKSPATFGLGFNEDERFREYCRRNVNFWRSQRELI